MEVENSEHVALGLSTPSLPPTFPPYLHAEQCLTHGRRVMKDALKYQPVAAAMVPAVPVSLPVLYLPQASLSWNRTTISSSS